MLKKILYSALGLLALGGLALASAIPQYSPSYSNGVLDVTNLNSTIAAVNNMTGNGTPQAGTFTTLKASDQISSTAGTPSIASGNCGATTNGAVATGSTNQSGSITIGSASTTTCQVDFSKTLGATPRAVIIFPANATAAATGTTVAYVSALTTAHFIITGSALASANYYYYVF